MHDIHTQKRNRAIHNGNARWLKSLQLGLCVLIPTFSLRLITQAIIHNIKHEISLYLLSIFFILKTWKDIERNTHTQRKWKRNNTLEIKNNTMCNIGHQDHLKCIHTLPLHSSYTLSSMNKIIKISRGGKNTKDMGKNKNEGIGTSLI